VLCNIYNNQQRHLDLDERDLESQSHSVTARGHLDVDLIEHGLLTSLRLLLVRYYTEGLLEADAGVRARRPRSSPWYHRPLPYITIRSRVPVHRKRDQEAARSNRRASLISVTVTSQWCAQEAADQAARTRWPPGRQHGRGPP